MLDCLRHAWMDPPIREMEAEPADKPGSVVDSHSSRRYVAATLKQPTRIQRGPRQWIPIWSCSRWGLPCRSVTRLAVRSYRTISPLPAFRRRRRRYLSVALSVGLRRPGVTWHLALWSPDFPRHPRRDDATVWPAPPTRILAYAGLFCRVDRGARFIHACRAWVYRYFIRSITAARDSSSTTAVSSRDCGCVPSHSTRRSLTSTLSPGLRAFSASPIP